MVLLRTIIEGNANDESVNKNDGIVHGRNSYSTGINGQAISLDGVSDYVELDENMSTDYFGISAWFKSNSYKTGIDNYMYLTRLRLYGYGILVNYPDVGSIEFRSYSSASAYHSYSVDGNYNDNKWHHVVMNYGEESGFKVYIDGNMIYQDDKIDNQPVYYESGGGYSIGKDGNHDSDFFQGEIDELRIYNRPLLKSEVEQLYDLHQ